MSKKRRIVNHKTEGQIVNVTAKLDKKKERPLYFFVKAVGDNTELDYLGKSDRAGFGPDRISKMIAISDTGGVCKPKKPLYLSCSGLDKFKVTVSKKRDGKSVKEAVAVYEVWRKIFYSYRTLDSSYDFDFKPVVAKYKEYGIILEEVSNKKIKALPDENGVTKTAQPKMLDHYDTDGLQKLFDPIGSQRSKRECRIMSVESIRIPAIRPVVPSFQVTDARFQIWTGGPLVWMDGPFIFGTIGGIPVAQIPGIHRIGNMVFVDISSHAALKQRIDNNQPVGVSVQIKVIDEALNGLAWPTLGLIIIAANVAEPKAKKKHGLVIAQVRQRKPTPRIATVVHEIGHGLGLVHETIAKFGVITGAVIAAEPHPDFRPDKDENGLDRVDGHCNFDSKPETFTADQTSATPQVTVGNPSAQTTPSSQFVGEGKGGCVMFFYEDDKKPYRPRDFCDSCGIVVRAKNMSKKHMIWPDK